MIQRSELVLKPPNTVKRRAKTRFYSRFNREFRNNDTDRLRNISITAETPYVTTNKIFKLYEFEQDKKI